MKHIKVFRYSKKKYENFLQVRVQNKYIYKWDLLIWWSVCVISFCHRPTSNDRATIRQSTILFSPLGAKPFSPISAKGLLCKFAVGLFTLMCLPASKWYDVMIKWFHRDLVQTFQGIQKIGDYRFKRIRI